MLRLLFVLIALFCSFYANSAEPPSTAFYYANHIPLDLLSAYDRVVLEPENASTQQVNDLKQRGVTVYAYLSIGEVSEQRHWFAQIQPSWIKSRNKNWKSAVMDMRSPEWHHYLIHTRMQQLWQQGYRGFFLDTMDSYQLFAKSEYEQLKQQQGMVSLIKAMKQQYPEVSLLFNRGFEILDKAAQFSDGVIAESLFAGWNPTKSKYQAVPKNDREWLLGKLKQARDEFNLPVTVIDYLPPEQREQAVEVAKKISLAGFTPWVSTPALDYMGVGSLQLIPREVLFLYDSREIELAFHNIHRFLAMPLEYLGHIPVSWDVKQGMPTYRLKGRFAGIVIWLMGSNVARDRPLANWVFTQVQQQIPLALMGSYTLANNQKLSKYLQLDFPSISLTPPLKLKVTQQMGYEIPPVLYSVDLPLLHNLSGHSWLSIMGQQGKQVDPVLISSWGGVALDPYILADIPTPAYQDDSSRWIINPFKFLKAALQLKAIPIADATTENGNRILTIHIDGDGFYNKTELGGNRYSSELIRDEFIKPLSFPHTVSIIEGEIGQTGLKPELSDRLQTIARSIFKLPNVEIASHTYSHPFDWFQAAVEKTVPILENNRTQKSVFKAEKGYYHLPILGYKYNAEREIKGSVDYINRLLAPKGKQTKVLLWSGNCLPDQQALSWTEKIHVANLNGGDTVIRNGLDSITNISSSGIVRGPYFQPYAPIQNENVYTNDWTGPFYGYQRVLETFQLTDLPKRFKPISIYYHFYSGDRLASVRALHRVYDWAIKQETLPLWISEYTPRLYAFRHAVYEQLENGWRIHGAQDLRTLRLPILEKKVDMYASKGVMGYRELAQGRYIALNGEPVIDLYLAHQVNPFPYLVKSNARVQYWRKNNKKIDFRLVGHQAVNLSLAQLSTHCILTDSQGKKIRAIKQQAQTHLFTFKSKDTGALQVICE